MTMSRLSASSSVRLCGGGERGEVGGGEGGGRRETERQRLSLKGENNK